MAAVETKGSTIVDDTSWVYLGLVIHITEQVVQMFGGLGPILFERGMLVGKSELRSLFWFLGLVGTLPTK